MAGKTVRAAVVQAGSVAFDLDGTLARMDRLAAVAAAQGARIAVFPEAFVGGYPKGADFGARVGSRTEEGRDDFLRYHRSAIDLPGPDADRIAAIARAHGLHLVTGLVERDAGTLYCTVVFHGPDGRYLGKHRKLMPTASERLIWGFGEGTTLPVIDTEVGKVGAVICWENHMPLLRAHMYRQGVQLYCAPTVDDRDIWIPAMQHVAYEGRCFVLSAAQYATRADYPPDYRCIQGDDPATVLVRGGSCIVDPFGRLLAGPLYGEEGVLVADLELDQIVRGKFDLDVTGHYARPDVFQLRVEGSHD